MSTDRLAEMAAEIERTVDKGIAECERLTAALNELIGERNEALNEVRRLRTRVAELEAVVAVGRGTMGMLMPDEPTTITHDQPPSAPPHDE